MKADFKQSVHRDEYLPPPALLCLFVINVIFSSPLVWFLCFWFHSKFGCSIEVCYLLNTLKVQNKFFPELSTEESKCSILLMTITFSVFIKFNTRTKFPKEKREREKISVLRGMDTAPHSLTPTGSLWFLSHPSLFHPYLPPPPSTDSLSMSGSFKKFSVTFFNSGFIP